MKQAYIDVVDHIRHLNPKRESQVEKMTIWTRSGLGISVYDVQVLLADSLMILTGPTRNTWHVLPRDEIAHVQIELKEAVGDMTLPQLIAENRRKSRLTA